MPYPDLPHENNDILLLTWKRPSTEPHSTFFPNSSWNQGRNRLLLSAISRANETNNPYLYYIFLDEDCKVKEDEALAARLGVTLTGNPFRTFERYLMQWRPAVGYTRYSWQYYETGKEMNLGYNFDALLNAYHREAVSFLLPYYTGFDSASWLYSQNIINHLVALLYNAYRIQFNVIMTKNKKRQGYDQREKDWTIPTRFLLEAIRSDLKHHMNTETPNTIYPNPGAPLKKDRSYVIESTFVKKHFDVRHPFVQSRRFLLSKDTAVPGTPII